MCVVRTAALLPSCAHHSALAVALQEHWSTAAAMASGIFQKTLEIWILLKIPQLLNLVDLS